MRRRLLVLALLGMLAALPASIVYALTRPDGPHQVQAWLSVTEALGGDGTSGFAQAMAPRTFSFPADHGPHPEYRIEWWYFTGNLGTPEGRRFGYELTFFRTALAPEAAERESRWGTRQVYTAHLALSDIASGRFHAFQRFSREAVGLAGAQAQPFRVWLEDWSAQSTGQDALPLRLRASQGDVAIELVLDSSKTPVLHGEGGLSRKGSAPGNASYYYSLTRMPTSGTVRVAGQTFAVSGLSWMDREWSTSALEAGQVGWDWFSLQLDDGREVMFYRLRRQDGTSDPHSSGTLVMADGQARHLALADVRLDVLDYWQSPLDGTRYPSRWQLAIPGEGLELEIVPSMPDQELDLAVRYWEGAAQASGTADGQPIAGQGYVELTGYAPP